MQYCIKIFLIGVMRPSIKYCWFAVTQLKPSYVKPSYVNPSDSKNLITSICQIIFFSTIISKHHIIMKRYSLSFDFHTPILFILPKLKLSSRALFRPTTPHVNLSAKYVLTAHHCFKRKRLIWYDGIDWKVKYIKKIFDPTSETTVGWRQTNNIL